MYRTAMSQGKRGYVELSGVVILEGCIAIGVAESAHRWEQADYSILPKYSCSVEEIWRMQIRIPIDW